MTSGCWVEPTPCNCLTLSEASKTMTNTTIKLRIREIKAAIEDHTKRLHRCTKISSQAFHRCQIHRLRDDLIVVQRAA